MATVRDDVAKLLNATSSKIEVEEKPKEEVKEMYRVRQAWDDVKSQIGAYTDLNNAKKACDKVSGYYVFNNKGEIVYPEEVVAEDTDKLKVGDEVELIAGATYSSGKAIPAWVFDKKLYLREFRNDGRNAIISTVKSGAITGIVAVSNLVPYGSAEKTPVAPFKPYLVRINTDVLNVRAGAGTKYRVTTQVKYNQIYTIVAENNGWGKLKSGAGWICLDYTKTL
jgi:hypothetical protein